MALKIKRTRMADEEMSLASTADIAFLLIVFFLAVSALLELKGIQISLPKKDAPPMKVLRKDLFKIYIRQDGSYTHKELEFSLDALMKELHDALLKNSQLIAVLNVHPDAPAERIPEIVNGIQKSGITSISISMLGK